MYFSKLKIFEMSGHCRMQINIIINLGRRLRLLEKGNPLYNTFLLFYSKYLNLFFFSWLIPVLSW